MDDERFDRISKTLAAAPSGRAMLRGGIGAALALLGGTRRAPAESNDHIYGCCTVHEPDELGLCQPDIEMTSQEAKAFEQDTTMFSLGWECRKSKNAA
jgi:hypothetical protein